MARQRGNRNRGNKRNKQNNAAGGPKKTPVPPPPQTKLAFRNIENAEAFGSVEQVLNNLIQPMIEAFNAANNQSNGGHNSSSTTTSTSTMAATIEMDSSAVRFLIAEEEAALKYLEEEKKRVEELSATSNQDGKGEEANEGETKEGEESESAAAANSSNDTATPEESKEDEPKEEEKQLEIIIAPSKPKTVPVITARPLYVLPPKKTRRRGERAGVAYVLLTAPKIEKIEVPESLKPDGIIEEVETDVPELTDESAAVVTASADESTPKSADDDTASPPVTTTKDADEKAASPPDTTNTQSGEEEAASPPDTTTKSADEDRESPVTSREEPAPEPVPPIAIDYSRDLAKGRLLLSQAIEALQRISQEDSNSSQLFSNCRIEISMSGKTWRNQHHRQDRREGSIESTNDYKNWLQSLTTKQEDLKNRPKPAPGGGSHNLSSDGADNNGQPIAALVQHLKTKRQQLKRKKLKKKKEKQADKKSKEGKKRGGGGGPKGGGRGPGGLGGKKKKNKSVKNKVGSGAAAPALMQPPGATVMR